MVDATATLNEIVGALENMANQVVAQIADDRTYAEMWGWNQPAINRHDMATLIRRPNLMMMQIPDDLKSVDDATWARLSIIPGRINWVTGNTLPNMPGGNAFHCYLTVTSLIENIEETLRPLVPPTVDMEELEKRQLLPAAQARRLRNIDRGIDKLLNDSAALDGKITLINDAHATAEALPADLQMLRDAKKNVADTLKVSQTNQAGTETARGQAEAILKEIAGLQDQAVKLVQGTENAFSAATTKGLGEEFGKRAAQLSMNVWVLGGILAATLITGGVITFFRIDHINELLQTQHLSMQVLWAHVILSIASIAAPVWFAWLLTKQIGQRFRLSEDYAFKASVTKAYAGYSQEAARVDPEFQKKLYGTALARIDEEPLRHVETDNHGSPLHELLGSGKLRRALLKSIGAAGDNQSQAATPLDLKKAG